MQEKFFLFLAFFSRAPGKTPPGRENSLTNFAPAGLPAEQPRQEMLR